MDDLLKVASGLRIMEGDGTKLLAIQPSMDSTPVGAEPANDRGKPGTAGCHGVTRQDVGVDRWNAEALEACAHVTLAGRDPTCERHAPDTSSRHMIPRQGSVGSSSAVGESLAGDNRSSTNVFHSWHCGHCQSSSVLR